MARANALYYAGHDPFRDFTTAPEISQVFGELLGAWAAVAWAAMGHPAPFQLIELGGGRGTLMADALRAVRRVPGFAGAAQLRMVEQSPRLRTLQAAAAPGCTFHDSVADLPPGPAVVLANEFLDALPIRQKVRRADGWQERWVRGHAFVERPGAPTGLGHAPDGTVIELHDAAEALVAAMAGRLAQEGGVALFVDYGPARPGVGDTLQALRGGRPANPLDAPGGADLTAHVDFTGVARAARAAGAAVHGPVPQGVFLRRLGLQQRTEMLARGADPATAAALRAGATRLADPAAMGDLFKAIAICHPALPVLPGFEPMDFETMVVGDTE